jgi:hypothetical protein
MKLGNWLRNKLWRDDSVYRGDQMSCPQVTFVAISQDFYARLMDHAEKAGVTFEGTKATVEGCEFDWNYDPVARVLHVTCTKKPFLISCDALRDRITELVAHARSETF